MNMATLQHNALLVEKESTRYLKEVTEEEKAKDGSSSTTGMLPVDFFVIKENRY